MTRFRYNPLPVFANVLLFALLSLSAAVVRPTAASATIRVVVSILPQQYFVERIGGERVEVSTLVGPGQSPATYEPSPRQMVRVAQADVYFRIGVPIETALLPRIQKMHPALHIIDTRTDVPLRPMDTPADIFGADGHTSHSDHTHRDGMDPHIWLSPALVKIQAATIARALSKADPDGAAWYQAQQQAFIRELATLEQELTEALSHLSGRRMLVFHPSWGYFADQFQLRQIPIEISGKEPSPRQLAHIIEYAKREQIRVMFVQSQFSNSGAQAVMQALDGVVVKLDPLAEEYPDNMRRIANAVAQQYAKP